jgi:aspartate racemase
VGRGEVLPHGYNLAREAARALASWVHECDKSVGEVREGIAVKTIGVLGGAGPQATMDFEARLHLVCQRRIPQRHNTGYPPLVVYYHRHAPMVMAADGVPEVPFRADPRLLDTARRLGPLADFIAIPSNGTHLFRTEIEHAAGREVLSIIDVTVAEVRRRGWRRVGVLAYGEPVVYTRPLGEIGIACEIVDAAARRRLDESIMGLIEGRTDAALYAPAHELVAELRSRRVDGIIPGCTEIPLLLGESARDADLVNPAQLLAEAAIERALG